MALQVYLTTWSSQVINGDTWCTNAVEQFLNGVDQTQTPYTYVPIHADADPTTGFPTKNPVILIVNTDAATAASINALPGVIQIPTSPTVNQLLNAVSWLLARGITIDFSGITTRRQAVLKLAKLLKNYITDLPDPNV